MNEYLDAKIKVKDLKEMIQQFERGPVNNVDEMTIPFTYLMSRFFPDLLKTMMKNYSDSYTRGYIQGQKDERANS